MHFGMERGLQVFVPITYIKITLRKELFSASVDGRNNHNKQ